MLIVVIYDVLIILSAGLLAGLVCRRYSIPVIVGYLVVGCIIGKNSLHLISDRHHEIEHIAEAGVFFLLFSIGLEFSLEDLLALGKNLVIGGLTQMLLVAGPVYLALSTLDLEWNATFLFAIAVSFSSTVLVFKALSEWGQSNVAHGKRTIGILLFQDAALIPILLLVPLITGDSSDVSFYDFFILAVASSGFIAGVVFVRRLMARIIIPMLAGYPSPDLILLFTLVTIGLVTFVAFQFGLPPAIGAFAAGLMFSGNRWTHQVDALILPFRELFSAVFFVSLGLIASPSLLWQEPLTVFVALVAIILLKSMAAMLALRLTGLGWKLATNMGIGLGHIGEFAFVIMLLGWEAEIITDLQYQYFVTLALLSLVISTILIRYGMKRSAGATDNEIISSTIEGDLTKTERQALVVGAGPTGRQVASRLEIMGLDVCVVDINPINLHAFAQQGFQTISGDATRIEILTHAHAEKASLIIVCISDDAAALSITRQLRSMNKRCSLLIRCRYHENLKKLQNLGATHVISEEVEATGALLDLIRRN